MADREASALLRRHRLQVAAIAEAAAKQVSDLARKAPTGDIDKWFEQTVKQIMEIVAVAFEVIRRLTAAFLQEHADLNGAEVTPVLAELDFLTSVEGLRITGPVAFKQHMTVSGGDVNASRAVMAKRMAGSVQRQAMAADRDTTHQTIDANESIVGWRRVSDGSPCSWCAMLISRGAVYKSKRSAETVVGRRGVARGAGPEARAIGQSYHDNDGCTAVPLYESEEEPEDVDALYDEWNRVTGGLSGRAALKAWRRHWDGKQHAASKG